MQATLEQRLESIESMLKTLIEQRTVKSHYTTAEVAEIIGRSNYTVREWCRGGRLNSMKKASGRGDSLEWTIPHEELDRYRSAGLLPAKK